MTSWRPLCAEQCHHLVRVEADRDQVHSQILWSFTSARASRQQGMRLLERNGKCMVLFYISSMRTLCVCVCVYKSLTAKQQQRKRIQRWETGSRAGTGHGWPCKVSETPETHTHTLTNTQCACINIRNNKFPHQCMDEGEVIVHTVCIVYLKTCLVDRMTRKCSPFL